MDTYELTCGLHKTLQKIGSFLKSWEKTCKKLKVFERIWNFFEENVQKLGKNAENWQKMSKNCEKMAIFGCFPY
jgi:poly(A) polymerase Pap1